MKVFSFAPLLDKSSTDTDHPSRRQRQSHVFSIFLFGPFGRSEDRSSKLVIDTSRAITFRALVYIRNVEIIGVSMRVGPSTLSVPTGGRRSLGTVPRSACSFAEMRPVFAAYRDANAVGSSGSVDASFRICSSRGFSPWWKAVRGVFEVAKSCL